MWPVIPIPLGTHPEQIYTYSLLIALGVCHLFLGVDAAARRQKLGRAESSKYLYCLGLACGGGWVFAMVVTRWLYDGQAPWGTAAAMPGLIGGAVILFVAAKAFHVPLRQYLEVDDSVSLLHARLGTLGLLHGGVLPWRYRPKVSLGCNSPPTVRRANSTVCSRCTPRSYTR